ncbi:MAG: damage-inducible protein DinB, partial [Rhodospirillaceae bacterium]|nr:damage-inducible protein DinB [Rhodospirillaceae bacterium]
AAPAISEMAESTRIYAQWEDLSAARTAFDETITSWAAEIDQKWLDGDLTWTSVANNRTFSKPMWQLVTHMFNHQTHHRGQVHAMLTAAGARPDDTDIPFMPARSNHD